MISSSRHEPGQPGFIQMREHPVRETRRFELRARDVDGHAQVAATGLPPFGDLLERLAHHLVGELHDEAGLFGHRDELIRRHDAARGMAPAHQCLDAGDAAGGDFDLRLIDEEQLVLLERAPQFGFELQPFHRARAHVFAVDDAAVAARGLRFVQREARGAQQLVAETAVVRKDRDADRAGHEEIAVPDEVRRGERGGDVGDGLLHVGVGLQVPDRDGEFVAREPRQRHGHRAIAFELEESAEAQRHGLQQRVTGAVADAVVDALELVEIDAQHGESLAGGGRFAACFFQQLQQVLPVRQLRQRIEERELADAVRGAMTLGHVTQHQQQAAAVVGHDARFETALDAVADAFEFHLGALVAHAAVIERVRDGARRVAADELRELLLVADAAGEERMIVGGAQPIDDAVVQVDHQQQVGQGVEHGALAPLALFELLHQSSAAHQVLHAMA